MKNHASGYHPEKLSELIKKRDRQNKTLKELGFYHWPVWRRVRLLILQRDHYSCKLRLSKKCTRIATEVHHIKDLEEYPELALDEDNLISCCWWCHEETKQRKQTELPRGVRIIKVTDGSDQDDG